jgi:hypothetical protein
MAARGPHLAHQDNKRQIVLVRQDAGVSDAEGKAGHSPRLDIQTHARSRRLLQRLDVGHRLHVPRPNFPRGLAVCSIPSLRPCQPAVQDLHAGAERHSYLPQFLLTEQRERVQIYALPLQHIEGIFRANGAQSCAESV